MALVDTLSATLDAARRQADRVVAPDTRHQAYSSIERFARQQPLLFSFLTAQTLFALLPVLLFTSFALATTILACASALCFVLFWAGLAALVLGSALCVSFTLAVFAWAWLVGGFVVGKWMYGVVAGPGKVNARTSGEWKEGRYIGDEDGQREEKVIKTEDGDNYNVFAEKSKPLTNGDGQRGSN